MSVAGGAKVDDRVFRELRRKIGRLADAHVKVGVLSAQANQPHEGSDMTIVEIAAVHEYGSEAAGIPERSFIRATFEGGEAPVQQRDLSAKLARQIIAGDLSPEEALQVLGQWGVAQVKKKITSRIPPPLKEATIKRKTVGGKRGDVPLVDTGQLISSITYEVKDK